MSNEDLLYYGDNLDVLRRYVPDASVDLVYLDPPFNSAQDYNVLFKERDGKESSAQITAFVDTWRWDQTAARAFQEIVDAGGKVSQAMQAFRTYLGSNDMLAYLAMMAPRLVELRRVLKDTGSLYLHCDPTASHYLKILLDAIFGAVNFRNEIIWKRSSSHSDAKQGMRRCGRIHDTILFYTKGDGYQWNPVFTQYDKAYVESMYRFVDENGRRYREGDLTAARPGGDVSYEWRVKRRKDSKERWVADLEEEYRTPLEEWEYQGVYPYKGRYWAYSRENMAKMWKNGEMIHRSTGFPQYKRYLEDQAGVHIQDLWTDINPLSGAEKERLGYPTQKPEALLERIIKASSNEGDLVLDPFCGCGTTVSVAQRLKRRWIGVDITHLSINLMKQRLRDTFLPKDLNFKVIGEPMDLAGAADLAQNDLYQFQWWALGLVGARPVEGKKGADKGIDGRIYFHDEADTTLTKQVILQVKAGDHVTSQHVRDLRGVIERENAAIGVLISLKEPGKPMRTEAAEAGFYRSPGFNKDYPRLQLLTIRELLDGKTIDMPPLHQTSVTFKKAAKMKLHGGDQTDLLS